MHPNPNPAAIVLTLAILAFLAWFALDGYFRADPSAPPGEPAGSPAAQEVN